MPRNDEGERHLLMDQVKTGGVTTLPSPASTSSCPGSGCSSSMSNSPSPGSACCSDDTDVKMEVGDESVDVCQFIPEPVRKNEPILKPPPKEENISFAKLLQTDNLKPYLYGGVEAMDTSDTSSHTKNTDSNATGEKETSAVAPQNSTTKVPSTVVVKDNTPSSPSHQHSPSSDDTADTPPPLEDAEAHEDDENLFKDLLDITKNDKEEDFDGNICDGFSTQNYMFTVNSPDNLSQILGSPSNVSIGSPASHLCVEDETRPLTPGAKSVDCNVLPSGILAGLLNSKVSCNDIVSMSELPTNPNPSTHTMVSMNVTKIDPPPQSDSVLPDDIANFSLDFCRNVMDQTASDIVTSLAGNLDLVQSFEDTTNFTQPTQSGASICELGDNVPGSNVQTVTSPAPQAAASNLETEPVTPVTLSPRENTPDPNVMLKQNEGKFPIPVPTGITIPADTPNLGGTESQPMVGCSHDHTHVTERISRLDIQDNQAQQGDESCATLERTPLLHALLTGAEANPVAIKASANNPGACSQGAATLQNGVNGVHQNAAKVDNFDAFLQDLNTSSTSDSDGSSINNNLLNQDDLTLLQAHEQQRLLLMEQQKLQQENLMQQQMAQQKLLEQKFQEQLLRRKQLQKIMEMKRKVQQMQQQTSLPQSVAGAGNQQVGTVYNFPDGQAFSAQQPMAMLSDNLAVNGNNGKQPQQPNFPIPNLSAADIQRLQQQKLHQEQAKQQLLLQQRQQREMQQMQQQLTAAGGPQEQQQSLPGGTAGQSLLLQQALMQQQQQPLQQPVATSLSQCSPSQLNQVAESSVLTSWTNPSL